MPFWGQIAGLLSVIAAVAATARWIVRAIRQLDVPGLVWQGGQV
jgi:hypothetical protein